MKGSQLLCDFILMYGDRKPKSFFARLFAIAWILGGISLLSIFTAIVTSALSASIQLNFRKHGAVLGAMNGSEEYRLGVNLNADVKVFNHVETMIMSLAKGDIDGALVDNYVITHHLDIMQKEPIRIEEHISHAVTYGVVLGHGSSEFEFCARRYIRHHPQDVFEAFARHLTPLKNPTDDVSSQSKAAERLIFQPKSLSVLVYGGLGIVLILSAIGIVWDFACRRQKITVHNSWKKATKKLHVLSKQSQERIGKRLALIEKPTRPWNADELDELITKYQAFHRKWLDKLTAMKDAGVITVNTV
ncbi:hypothetical protein OS493_009595 [Desmophyllum pertusum]|uniref:Potassium channel domain-containing protein n=1 Tax=Desmophyllum pertusum TaxID=174260 RepID=A0A9X0CLW2_9CNID|nr:hypothetical protein OS493_009595 [Desmophyllum pertusum]